jgi:hypothetical protein
MSNIQLTAAERPVVYLDKTTRRVLGFGQENVKPLFPAGTHYIKETLYHVWDIDRYSRIFREQWRRDQELDNFNQIAREKPLRDAIKEALRARGPYINAANRAQNEAMIRVMDFQYDQAMAAKLRKEVCLTAERWDASKTGEDIAISDPGFAKVHRIDSEAHAATVRRSEG